MFNVFIRLHDLLIHISLLYHLGHTLIDLIHYFNFTIQTNAKSTAFFSHFNLWWYHYAYSMFNCYIWSYKAKLLSSIKFTPKKKPTFTSVSSIMKLCNQTQYHYNCILNIRESLLVLFNHMMNLFVSLLQIIDKPLLTTIVI